MSNVLSKKAVLANLTISRWGVRRFDKGAAAEVLESKGAESHAGLFTKRLLNKKAMEDIRSTCGAARAYHHSHTQPWMEDGTRILPTALYLDYSKAMSKYKEDFQEAVNAFAKEYPTYVKQAQKELGKLFNAADYPAPGLVKAKFSLDVVIMPCADPSDFRVSLDAADMAEIKADLEKRLNQQLELALKDVGERITEVVGHMVERLNAYEQPNKKKGTKAKNTFRDSLVSNVKELADLLPAFNLNGDPKLVAIHKRVMKELCVDPDALREDALVRKSVTQSAEEILKDVSAFMA